jgi:selenocysteine-specific elongation factor
MKSQKIIIGTSGHVDHGKSALAKELTGVDPDRLPEEKKREMTIDLGFVFFPLNEQEEIAIIDVPGHERFLKTMIAGAASIRMVLFVVAADEGVMPQTIEHLDVLKLLGIKKGIIIITKVDKVEKEYVEIVKEDVEKLTKGSFLENAPVFTVSSVTKQGIEELKTALKKYCSEIEPLFDGGIFRCPIDRIFSMKGFGSVVAGTVISGRLKKIENIEVLPIGNISRIRNLQVHNQSVSEVFVGQRAAFNLTDISITDIARGYELSVPDYLKPTTVIDAHLSLLANLPKPLKQNQRIRLHKGTSEVMTRVRILDKNMIEPGGDGYVQLRLEKSLVGERGERFIIRSYSPMRVIGGGKFLSLYPVRGRRRSMKERIEHLQKIESARNDDLVELVVLYALQPVVYGKELMRLTNLPLSVIDNQVQRLLETKKVIKLKDGALVHERTLDNLKKACFVSVEQFINANPLKVVMSRGKLAKTLQISHQSLLDRIFEDLSHEGKIEIKVEGIKIAGKAAKLSTDAQRLSDKIENFVINQGYRPFRLTDINNAFPKETQARIKNVFEYLLKNDILIKIGEGTYLHKEILHQAKSRLIQQLNEKGSIRAVEYKDILDVSRNVARDILDYFFDQGITLRTKGTHTLVTEQKSRK